MTGGAGRGAGSGPTHGPGRATELSVSPWGELTDRPFGVNLVLHFPAEDHVAICREERVPILSLFWGDPTAYVERAHAAGRKVFHEVVSVADAQRAAVAGVGHALRV